MGVEILDKRWHDELPKEWLSGICSLQQSISLISRYTIMRPSAFLSLVALAVHTQAVKLRKTEFNVLISSRPALILFTAEGCKECDRVQAVLDRVSPVLTKTAIASINCNDEPTVCDDSQVFTVPTLKYTTGNNELVTYREALDASSWVSSVSVKLFVDR